jgi:hypothetical protein
VIRRRVFTLENHKVARHWARRGGEPVKGESAPAQFSTRLDFEAHAAATAGEYVSENIAAFCVVVEDDIIDVRRKARGCSRI